MPWRTSMWMGTDPGGTAQIWQRWGPYWGPIYIDRVSLELFSLAINPVPNFGLGFTYVPGPTPSSPEIAGEEAWGFQAGGAGTRSPEFPNEPGDYPVCRWGHASRLWLRALWENPGGQPNSWILAVSFWSAG